MSKRIGKKVVAQPKENWILLPDITPPIITEEMFKQTQMVLSDAKQSRPLNMKGTYLLTGFAVCSKCGTGLIGTTLTDKKYNRKYRYYQCRNARPTSTRGRICDAGYIKADWLEKAVSRKFTEMMISPLLHAGNILELAKPNAEPYPNLDKDISRLRKKIKTYPMREQNLYDLLASDSVNKDFILKSVSKLKQECSNDEKQLEFLLSLRDESESGEILNLKITSIPVDEIVKVSENEPFEEKRLSFQAFKLKVKADPVSFSFTIQLGATIISPENYQKAEAKIEKLFKEFQAEHPESTMTEYMNFILNEKPEEYSKIFRLLNNQANLRSNLVTIAQTSECLPFHAYIPKELQVANA